MPDYDQFNVLHQCNARLRSVLYVTNAIQDYDKFVYVTYEMLHYGKFYM